MPLYNSLVYYTCTTTESDENDELPDWVMKNVDTSTTFPGSLALGESNHHIMRILKQSCGEVYVLRN